jgi:hypothetical protein
VGREGRLTAGLIRINPSSKRWLSTYKGNGYLVGRCYSAAVGCAEVDMTALGQRFFIAQGIPIGYPTECCDSA